MHNHASTQSSLPLLPRRSFLRGILAAGAAPFILPALSSDVFAAAEKKPKYKGPKVRLACVGIGGQGWNDISAFAATGIADVVALCDTEIDGPRIIKPDSKAKGTRSANALDKFPKAARFQDFRKMFDKMANQIDAVLVATPDFSHFPITILAMSLGKPVFVEKPMAHSFRQLELLIAAEKKYGVATQMGNQGHSGANYFQFKAWTEAGIIKNITRINAHMNSPRRWFDTPKKKFSTISDYLPEEPTPEFLDWNTWLATALDHKYNIGYVRGDWRCWYDFGNGALGDWGAHIFDTAHQFLELGLPHEVNPVRIDGHNPFVFPQASTLSFKFPVRGDKPALDLVWYDGLKNLPPMPKNAIALEADADIPPPGGASAATTKAKTKVPANGKEIYSTDGLTFQGGTHGQTLSILEKDKAKALNLPAVEKGQSDHYANFLLAVRGDEKTRSPFSVAGPLCETMALGVIAQRVNSKLLFDRNTKRITNNSVADRLLDGVPPRPEWEQFYKL